MKPKKPAPTTRIKALTKEVESLKTKLEIAISELRLVQQQKDDAVKLVTDHARKIKDIEHVRAELIRDNQRMREMGPKNMLRVVHKLTDEILDNYDDGLE